MSLRPAERLGPYEIVAPLGAGGMGEVYRARDERLGREVALKVLVAGARADKAALARFEQEARAASALDHPNILAVHDVGMHEGAAYLVTELLAGQTLRDRLADGPLPLRKALDFAIALAQGLAAAHDKGIVHRDLKPENLFLTDDGRFKILDFGVAKLTRSLERGPLPEATADETAPGAIIGTVGYMAPEQVRGQPADHRSDLFALGAILYEMLAGRRAFQGDSPIETATAILKNDPPPLSGVPAPVESVVARCLEKSPAERFQSARDIAFCLHALSATSSRPLPAEPAAGQTRRALLVGGLAALPVGIGAFLLGRRTAKAPLPLFTRLTFRHGVVDTARFAADGQTVVYGAATGQDRDIFTTRAGSPESRSLGLAGVKLLALNPQGDLALLTGLQVRKPWSADGTLAIGTLAGGAPREVTDNVQQADFAADGTTLALVRRRGGRSQLEYPPGRVLHESRAMIRDPRLAPDGNHVAFFDHPLPSDDRGSVAVVDRAGHYRTLSAGWESLQGLAWSPSGELWFTGSEAGAARSLYAVTLDGRQRVVARVPGGLVLADLAGDGRALAMHEISTRRQYVKTAATDVERDLSWFDWSDPSALSSDGKLLLFTELSEGVGREYAVYLRRTDGAPAVRLGKGMALALSPDGKSALSRLPSPEAPLVLLPTGAGDPIELPRHGIDLYGDIAWLPDGSRLLFAGRQGAGPRRLYLQRLPGGAPEVLSDAEVCHVAAVSPDGERALILLCEEKERRWAELTIESGEVAPITWLSEKDHPVQWLAGDTLIVDSQREAEEGRSRLVRADLARGVRTPWRDIAPPDSVSDIGRVIVSRDGSTWAWSVSRRQSDLYLIDGLR